MSDGGPAFPHNQRKTMDGADFISMETGMSLLDYFAATALRGILSDLISENTERLKAGLEVWEKSEIAQESYEYAQEMLKAREAFKK